MNSISKSATWLVVSGVIGLAACSGKLRADDGQPSGSGGSGATAAQPQDAPVVGAPAHCPAAQPNNGEACDVERAACSYAGSDTLYRECYCAESQALDLRWFCMDRGIRGPDCPAARVKDGQPCTGLAGTQCSYPIGERCQCAPTETWSCFNIRPADLPSAPSAPEPSTPINELSDADRSAWCDWYELAMAGETPEDSPVGTDGTLNAVSCGFGYGAACNVAFPQLSPGQCAQNLAVSNCAAPIATLTDCITTTQNGCVPEPHGCARFLASANCNGTMVNDLGPNGSTTGGANAGRPDPCIIRVQ